MAKSHDIKQFAVQKLREIFPRATGWEEISDHPVGAQRADLLVRFKMGTAAPTLILEFSSVGQPRQIRESIARLGELHRDLPSAYPVAVAEYVESAERGLAQAGGAGISRSLR